MFQWMEGNNYTMLVTVYPTNITLNTAAANYFKDYRWCMIGFDSKSKQMAIKGVSKEKIDKGLVPLEKLHKISSGKGYARISNKSVILQIAKIVNDDSVNNKYSAYYDDAEQMLIVNLNKSIRGE